MFRSAVGTFFCYLIAATAVSAADTNWAPSPSNQKGYTTTPYSQQPVQSQNNPSDPYPSPNYTGSYTGVARGYDLNEYMAPHEQASFGLDRLSPQEREALARWLLRFKDDARRDERGAGFFYRIERNWNSGAEIHLDNNTIWRISPLFRRATRYWLKDHHIEVIRKIQTGSSYPHQLYNQNTGETVDARLMQSGP